jgi:hypothetical protein
MEGGPMFGRQAWVGIAHDDIGKITGHVASSSTFPLPAEKSLY